MSAKPRAVGVIRLSTAEQAQEGRAGIDRQKTDIETSALRYGLDVIRVVEVIESGAKVRGQRDFERIFAELKTSAVDGVVCSNLDRLVRPDRFEDFAVFDNFRLNRKKIWTPGEVVDPSTQGGFLISGFRGLFAGLERQLIAQRTQDGKEAYRKRGWHGDGGSQSLPRGVAVERLREGRRVVDFRWFYTEPDASIVRRAYQLLLEGFSYRAIADAVGNGWSNVGLRYTLANTIWYGVRTYPPCRDRKEPLQIRVIPEAEALVSKELWDRAQVILSGRKKSWGARKREPRFLLAGMLRCSCGKPFYQRVTGRRQEHYACAGRATCGTRWIQRQAADDVIVSTVRERFLDPEFLIRLLDLSQQRPETKTDASALEAELMKLDAKRQRFIDAYGEGAITLDELRKRQGSIDEAKRGIEAMLPAKTPAYDARRIAVAVAEFFAGFGDQEFSDKRRVLRAAFREFRVQNSAVVAITINGGFLGNLNTAKLSERSTAPSWLLRNRHRPPSTRRRDVRCGQPSFV
jgi:DNA invertase Pin-like site-specific DNA recombinase